MYELPARSPCICVNLRRATRTVTDLYDRVMAPAGLRVTQYALLRAVARLGEPSITDLAEQLALDRTTLSRNLRPLERRGLVKIRPGRDRRRRTAALTADGRAAIERAAPLWRQAQSEVAEHLGGPRLEALLSGLHALDPL